jgi:hypothetical protein
LTGPHLVPVAGTGWHAWRWALLRSAGFPADGPAALSAPGCAEAADACLAGRLTEAEFAGQFAAATETIAGSVWRIAADPAFRTALNWQNPSAAAAVQSAAEAGPQPSRRAGVRRREELIGKYWQRYCVKNDTVGFFGPICWVRLEPDGPPVRGGPGPSLWREAHVHFERWALAALAEQIAADPQARPSLPIALPAGDVVADGRLAHPSGTAEALSAAEAALLERCDGRRSAREIARELVDAGTGPFRRESDVYALLERAAERGTVRWGIDLPMDLTAETALRGHVQRIADPGARARAEAAIGRLCAARDATAAARTPEALVAALDGLNTTFSQVTGQAPARNPGQAYAGRTLCHLDATRDLDLTFGPAVLDQLAPIEPLLLSARWLTATVADAVQEMLTDLYRDLAAGADSAGVPFAKLWFLALGPLLGQDAVPEKVMAEFASRWSAVLGLGTVPAGTSRLEFTVDEILTRVKRAFPAAAPGWAAARIHSPDLHICAQSVDDVRHGRFSLVLGELHIGSAAFDTHFFALGHPSPGELGAAMRADIPVSRVRPLIPDDWPRSSARNAEWMVGPDDAQLGFAPAPGADPGRLVPVTALTVVPDGDTLCVRADDGRQWPVIEMFASLLGLRVYDAWKLVGAPGHTPRITVGGLVLLRETWRTSVADTGLSGISGERDRFLAAREWRRRLGLPERVFVLIGTEPKPCYIDLASPVYTRILCAMLRAAGDRGGPQTPVVVTELLPRPQEAWLTDSEGQRYCSELRLQLRDPVAAGPVAASARTAESRAGAGTR